MSLVTCPYCKYEWQSRVEKPKKCPHCKRDLFKTDTQLQHEKERQERTLPTLELNHLVNAISYVNCKVCGKPALARVIEKDKRQSFCKEHLVQYVMGLKQPTQEEVIQMMNELSKGEIPDELQNLRT